MRNIYWGIIGFVFCIISCQEKTDPIHSYVKEYFVQYPEATLQDIYKGSFQDVFGPAHILTHRESVKNYILQEISQATTWEEKDYTPCGWQGNFYQVNLKVIADGRVLIDDFVDAFMASAQGIDTTLTQKFIDEWGLIQQTVRDVRPDLQGFVEDSTILSTLFHKGEYVVHHSEKFNEHYQPHYRIIRKDVFEKSILRLLNE